MSFAINSPYKIVEDVYKNIMKTDKCEFKKKLTDDILKIDGGDEVAEARSFVVERTMGMFVDDDQ